MTSLKESIKNLKVNELIEIAKKIKYIAPNKVVNEYNEDDVCYGSIFIIIHNEVLIRGMNDSFKYFPPLKLLLKTNLKNYIEYMVNLNN